MFNRFGKSIWSEQGVRANGMNPKGGLSVGRSVLFWTDASHREKAGPEGHNPRELAAFFSYPAEAKGETAEYFPGLAGLASAPETKMLSSGLRGGLSLEEPSAATYTDAPL
jgi:hypothetical protein